MPAAGIEIEWIAISGVRGTGLGGWLLAPIRVLRAVAQALGILHRVQPSAVLGMGGFVAGPGGIAAWLTRRPLLVHEQNSVPGSTNQWLARVATRVYEAFPGSFQSRRRAQSIGNPVRSDVRRVADPLPRLSQRWQQTGVRRLLILGGSQGARALNRCLPEAVGAMPVGQRPEIWHQCGRDAAQVEQAYLERGIDARVDAFIDDMAAAYAWADLAVCRAGALTLAELSAAGLGAVLVPFPHAIDNHQLKNARYFADRGSAVVIEEADLTSSGLAAELARLLGQQDLLMEMARVARSQDYPDAAPQLARACIEVGR